MTAQLLDLRGFAQFFLTGTERADGTESRALWEAMTDAADGGKRVRPDLLQATYEAFGGNRPEVARQVGDAIELLHTAFVMHDDVIDHDLSRRGRPNVSGAFEARATRRGSRARPRAAGTARPPASSPATSRSSAPPAWSPRRTPTGRRSRVCSTCWTRRACHGGGELGDVRLGLHIDRPTLADVLTVEEHKTAVYSFSLPLQAGALLAGVPDFVLPRLDRLGRLLGIAFQLQDDLLGTFGDEAVTGKSAVSDLREGTVTALVAHARTTAAWPTIAPHLGDPDLSEASADAVRDALVRCGSRAFVEDLVDRHVREALVLALEIGPVAEVVERLTQALLAVGRQIA